MLYIYHHISVVNLLSFVLFLYVLNIFCIATSCMKQEYISNTNKIGSEPVIYFVGSKILRIFNSEMVNIKSKFVIFHKSQHLIVSKSCIGNFKNIFVS